MLARKGFAILLYLSISLTACSPTYVIRAGIQEAEILLSRNPIEEILKDSKTSPKVRTMLTEVSRAKSFANTLALDANDSFEYYSEVDRDVLVWVLSAAPKNSLRFKTWWFPIVGNVPYKGFFEKEDALLEKNELTAQGFDSYVRPSLAFSTLGWFSDPLLSTMKKLDTISLVDTVFHELLHNTVWIPNHVEFNESIANAVGAFLSIKYFEHYYGVEHLFTIEAKNRWRDEIEHSKFISKICRELRGLYQANAGASEEKISTIRQKFFTKTTKEWLIQKARYRSKRYSKSVFHNNNAWLLAQTIYLSQLWEIDALYNNLDKDFSAFIKEIRNIKSKSKQNGVSPFKLLIDARKASHKN